MPPENLAAKIECEGHTQGESCTPIDHAVREEGRHMALLSLTCPLLHLFSVPSFPVCPSSPAVLVSTYTSVLGPLILLSPGYDPGPGFSWL